MENNFFTIIMLFFFLSALAATGLAIYYRHRAKVLNTKLTGAIEKLAKAHTDLQALEERYQDNLEFQKSLNEAELTTRLQQPLLKSRHDQRPSAAPERYLYVRSLAENGMEAPEIASILSISTQEAEQLVNLTRLAAISGQG